jgi:hypothetical protein
VGYQARYSLDYHPEGLKAYDGLGEPVSLALVADLVLMDWRKPPKER